MSFPCLCRPPSRAVDRRRQLIGGVAALSLRRLVGRAWPQMLECRVQGEVVTIAARSWHTSTCRPNLTGVGLSENSVAQRTNDKAIGFEESET